MATVHDGHRHPRQRRRALRGQGPVPGPPAAPDGRRPARGAHLDPREAFAGHKRWRGLRVTFPEGIASHSTVQDSYFGDDRLLRRHDYHVDIAGGFAAAQYVGGIEEADGIRFPTRRRAYLRQPDGRPDHDHVMVSIDLRDVHYA